MLPIMSKIDFRKNLLNLSNLISFYNLSLFTKIFCRFSDFFIEKTTFEEFVKSFLKGSDWNCMVVELRMWYCGEIV